MTDKKPAAVQVAHEIETDGARGKARVVERYGVRARLVPVPEGVLEDVERRIPDPDVPIVLIEEEGTEHENPNDPAYIKALEDAQRQRGVAIIEALCLFGVELLDGLPEDDRWRKKLEFYAKRGHIDLSWVDWDDPMEEEFVFVRYVFLTVELMQYLAQIARMTPEELARAEASFQGDAPRGADSRGGA
jgi:hypothetical protein